MHEKRLSEETEKLIEELKTRTTKINLLPGTLEEDVKKCIRESAINELNEIHDSLRKAIETFSTPNSQKDNEPYIQVSKEGSLFEVYALPELKQTTNQNNNVHVLKLSTKTEYYLKISLFENLLKEQVELISAGKMDDQINTLMRELLLQAVKTMYETPHQPLAENSSPNS